MQMLKKYISRLATAANRRSTEKYLQGSPEKRLYFQQIWNRQGHLFNYGHDRYVWALWVL